jgi:hypothetical protein
MANSAGAQTEDPANLSDLMMLGATIVPAAELKALLVQGKWRAFPNQGAVATFSSDGTYSGTQSTISLARAVGIFGDWDVSDAGELCMRPKNARVQPVCRYWYRVDQRLYGGGPPSELTLGVDPRTRVD